MKKIKNKNVVIFFLFISFLLFLGISYAYIAYNGSQRSMNNIETDCIEIEMKDLSSGIELINARPLTDEEGKNTRPYEFSIKNVCNVGVDYQVNMEVLEIENRLESKNIAYQVDKKEKGKLTSEKETTIQETEEYKAVEAYQLETGALNPGETKRHEIRIWLDESSGNETQRKTFQSKIVIKAIQNQVAVTYKEELLNGTDPILKGELVPVTIDDSGVVRKADIESEWYNYGEKKWANAVILQNSYEALEAEGRIHGAIKEEGYVHLDGIDDYIDLGLENYDFGNSITMAIRVKLNSIEGNPHFLGNWEGGGGGLWYHTNNKKFVSGLYIKGKGYIDNEVDQEIELNKYYTLVMSYNGEAIKMYINGELKRIVETTGDINPSKTIIGLGVNYNMQSSNDGYSNIDVKEAVIYDRALTEEEIKMGFSEEIEIRNSEGLLRYVNYSEKEYKDEEIIPEEGIESYFVWIPKYSYQLWDLGQYESLTNIDTSKVHNIPIKFGVKDTEDKNNGECTTPMNEERTQGLSGESGNCKIGDYMTHPSFISMNTNGLWVGKFESGYKGATNTTEAEVNEVKIEKLEIKPNVHSWRGIQVANAHLTSYNYKRELESHMMKNTEWGAVAYLQHSIFGSGTSVRINNNSGYITGYASTNEPTCGLSGSVENCNKEEYVISKMDGEYAINYLNNLSQVASTTGNRTGIYDMSGGAWEYMMSVVSNQDNQPMCGQTNQLNSGFNGINNDKSVTIGEEFPNRKYYDSYYGLNNQNYKNRILGDATGEMGSFAEIVYGSQTRRQSSWYNDEPWFVHVAVPWFRRGGNYGYGIGAGIYAFYDGNGAAQSAMSFRIVLAP